MNLEGRVYDVAAAPSLCYSDPMPPDPRAFPHEAVDRAAASRKLARNQMRKA